MRKAREAKLTLLDKAVAAFPLRPHAAAIWQQRINARRYIFDTEASRRVGEMMRDNVDLMVDNIEFARTPYPTCYFELDTLALWQGWRPEQNLRRPYDVKAGFLVHNSSVLVVASGQRPDTRKATDLPDEMVCGITFRINRPQSVPFVKLTGMGEVLADSVKQAYVFGGQRGGSEAEAMAVAHDSKHMTDNTWVFLPELPGAWTHSQVAAHFDVTPALSMGLPRHFVEMCFLGGGDPMALITMLLLLNQPSKYVALTHVAREQGIWHGKLKSFKEHHIVTLHLSAGQKVRDIFHTTDRASPIGHDVGGHWKHYNKSFGCNHHHEDERQAWEPVGPERTNSGDYKRYWCPLCLQRRTWTEDFHRGDSSTGHATKEYHVTD